jgi:hypothetical protein
MIVLKARFAAPCSRNAATWIGGLPGLRSETGGTQSYHPELGWTHQIRPVRHYGVELKRVG